MIRELLTETLHDRCVQLFLQADARQHIWRLSREAFNNCFRAEDPIQNECQVAAWACVLVGERGNSFRFADDDIHFGKISRLVAVYELNEEDSILSETDRMIISDYLGQWEKKWLPDGPASTLHAPANDGGSNPENLEPGPKNAKSKRMNPEAIKRDAFGYLAQRQRSDSPIKSKNELARLVGCSPNARSLCEAWTDYMTTCGKGSDTQQAHVLHDGLGELDDALEKLKAGELETLIREQETDQRSEGFSRRKVL
ncbi:hypothetical protein NZK35_06945 [Stieleria sp. ICT_E10.1]|uniref:hypothetical protein n=1 Tax=Stieleria sedimenti TaxID=2976331 RepID=UPI00217FB403|nr:hypothetical protein [Stieleria sedimenti]MCS7466410.1 hypothetical protein [Stieleria sedimenti]